MRSIRIISFKTVGLFLPLLWIVVSCSNSNQISTNDILEPAVSITINPITRTTEIVAPTASSTKTLEILTPIGEREQDQVLWLYETNNHCLLPCFWGIIPGETTWADAEKLFKRFDGSIYSSSNDSESIYYEAEIDLPRDIFTEDRSKISILAEDNKVQIIDARISLKDTSDSYLLNYRLSNFLTTYGQPSEIWVSSSPQSFENNELPFRVILFYESLGIMTSYSDNAILDGEDVIGCPQTGSAKFLSVWSPDKPLSFEEVKSGYAGFSGDFLPLSEVSSLDARGFYEIFKNPENSKCILTPAEIWRFD